MKLTLEVYVSAKCCASNMIENQIQSCSSPCIKHNFVQTIKWILIFLLFALCLFTERTEGKKEINLLLSPDIRLCIKAPPLFTDCPNQPEKKEKANLDNPGKASCTSSFSNRTMLCNHGQQTLLSNRTSEKKGNHLQFPEE